MRVRFGVGPLVMLLRATNLCNNKILNKYKVCTIVIQEILESKFGDHIFKTVDTMTVHKWHFKTYNFGEIYQTNR